jgi:glutathione S-transferase
MGSAAVTAISPLGKVPAIIDAGRPLFESAAICAWLADSHPEHRLIAPSGSWERALHDQWVSFCLSELEAHLWSTTRNTLLYPEERRVPAVLQQNREEGRRALAVLDAHLATTPFLIADRFSVADIVVGHCVVWSVETGWLDGFPHLSAYLDRLRAMPSCPYR